MNGILMKRLSRRNVEGIIDNMNMEVVAYKSKNGKVKPEPFEIADDSKIIRWGCTSYLPDSITYNSRESIKKASDKLLTRKILKENNINIPVTYDLEDILHKEYQLPLIARPKYHYGGKNFYFCETESQLRQAIYKGTEYFTEFYRKTREFRVHVCSGKVLICSEKFVDDINKVIWNLRVNDDGEFKAIKWSNIPVRIAKLGIDTVNALGLDFGAVDIISDPIDDNLPSEVVLEVNTAPKLGEYACERYAKYFDWLLYSEGKREIQEVCYDDGYWRGFVWSNGDLE